jgi:hypothetical protein
MAFAVGPTAQSIRGYGVPICDEKGSLVIFVEFATRPEAERAEAEIKQALSTALRIRNAQGQEW